VVNAVDADALPIRGAFSSTGLGARKFLDTRFGSFSIARLAATPRRCSRPRSGARSGPGRPPAGGRECQITSSSRETRARLSVSARPRRCGSPAGTSCTSTRVAAEGSAIRWSATRNRSPEMCARRSRRRTGARDIYGVVLTGREEVEVAATRGSEASCPSGGRTRRPLEIPLGPVRRGDPVVQPQRRHFLHEVLADAVAPTPWPKLPRRGVKSWSSHRPLRDRRSCSQSPLDLCGTGRDE